MLIGTRGHTIKSKVHDYGFAHTSGEIIEGKSIFNLLINRQTTGKQRRYDNDAFPAIFLIGSIGVSITRAPTHPSDFRLCDRPLTTMSASIFYLISF